MAILNEATSMGKTELIIPALTLEEFSEYTFKVTFQNIFLKQGSKTYIVKTSSYDAPSVSIV